MITLYFKNNNYYYERINIEKIKWWCKIRHIYVYKDGTDIYDCSCFCDQHNNVIEKIELPIEEEWRWTIDGCIKGTDESVFSYMKNDLDGECFFGEHEDGEVTILIPAEMLNIRFAGYTIDNRYITDNHRLKKVYKGDQNIYFVIS